MVCSRKLLHTIYDTCSVSYTPSVCFFLGDTIMSGVQKVAINVSWGGFSLTTEILARVHELLSTDPNNPDTTNEYFLCRGDKENRTNPALVQAILEARKNGTNGDLKVVEVPEGIDWCIQEHDGWEWVVQVHPTYNKWATL